MPLPNIRKFSDEEVNYILIHWNINTCVEIGKQLNRNPCSISKKIRKLGLRRCESQQKLLKNSKRKCSKCKEIKSIDNFYKLNYRKNRNDYSSVCKKCACEVSINTYYDNYKTLESYSEYIIEVLSKRRRCELTSDDIVLQYNKQNGKCYYTNEVLKLEANSLYTISVDRIDPRKDYTSDNIALCCNIVNLMKQGLLKTEFIEWCRKIITNNEI